MGITSWPCKENAFAPLSGVLSCATNGQGSAVVRWELMGRDRLERRNTFLVIEAMGSMEGMVHVDKGDMRKSRIGEMRPTSAPSLIPRHLLS